MNTTMQVAETIRAQIGPLAFRLIGASALVGDENSLTFKVGSNAKGVTHIKVTLDPSDTYTVSARKVRISRTTYAIDNRVVAEVSGVYFDGLRAAIESATGLYTSF
jgi:hypothetical protein